MSEIHQLSQPESPFSRLAVCVAGARSSAPSVDWLYLFIPLLTLRHQHRMEMDVSDLRLSMSRHTCSLLAFVLFNVGEK